MIIKGPLNLLLISMMELREKYIQSEQKVTSFNLDYIKISEFQIQVDLYPYLKLYN